MNAQSKIDIDFAVIMSQAKLLESIASEMEKLSTKNFDETLQEISRSWKGDNANAYLAKGNLLKGNMTVTAQSLREIAQKMKARAKFIYEREKAALEIAAERKY